MKIKRDYVAAQTPIPNAFPGGPNLDFDWVPSKPPSLILFGYSFGLFQDKNLTMFQLTCQSNFYLALD